MFFTSKILTYYQGILSNISYCVSSTVNDIFVLKEKTESLPVYSQSLYEGPDIFKVIMELHQLLFCQFKRLCCTTAGVQTGQLEQQKPTKSAGFSFFCNS